MQISWPVKPEGQNHHVIGTSMGSRNRPQGQRITTLSQAEYSIFSPVLCPAVVSWLKDSDSRGHGVGALEISQPANKNMGYRSLQGDADFHDAETDFRDSDGSTQWKEIHTDTDISTHTPELEQMHPHPLKPNNFLERIKSPTSALHTPNRSPNRSENFHNGGEQSTVSSNATPLTSSKSPRSKFLIPSTSPNDFYARDHTSAACTSVTNSPKHSSLWSPHRMPVETRSSLAAHDIPSPSATSKNFGWLTPTGQHARVSSPPSPDFARAGGHQRDSSTSSSYILPPARHWSATEVTPQSPSPAHSLTSSRPPKLMQQNQNGNASPRPKGSKEKFDKLSEKSSGKAWRNLSRSISPLFPGKKSDGVGSTLRGIGRDLGASFQGSRRRGHANKNNASVADWSSGSGDGSTAPPEPEKEGSDYQSELTRQGSTKSMKGSHNMFNFMSWGKKKSNVGGSKVNELFQVIEQGSVRLDSNSFKVMDYTIKTLQFKLEQAKKNEQTTASELKALQTFMETMDGKYQKLQQRCQQLESQIGQRRVDNRDMDMDYGMPRHSRNNTGTGLGFKAHRFTTLEVTPQLFQRSYDDAKLCVKKLASALCIHIRESGESATEVITSLLEQQKDAGLLVSKMPRSVIILYFESFLNQIMYENFENISYEPSGSVPILDPESLRATCCKAYNELKKQEWSSIEKSLGKPDSTIVNPTFHRFFVIRVELILSQLTKVADKETSLALLGTFFNAFKSVWLLHHLAFASDTPVSIFRVAPAMDFDPRYMEQVTTYEEDPSRSKISVMITPGFNVHRQTIKCQVFCSSKYY